VELRRADAQGSGPELIERSLAVAGHPGISWSIVLEAEVDSPVGPDEAARALAGVWPSDGSVGLMPTVEAAEAQDMDRVVRAMANRSYPPDGPFVRLTVARGSGRVVVAAHHAVLDGLGLVAVLGAALGRPVGTSARGLPPRGGGSSPPFGLRALYPVRRLAEGLAWPPVRVAPEGGHPSSGDHLVRYDVPVSVRTSDLVAACVRAVRDWNRRHGRRGGRTVVAVGASRGGGGPPLIGRQATWLRIPVDRAEATDVRRALRHHAPPPPEPPGLMRVAHRLGLAAALERRTGSTLLVSNLGRLMGEAGIVRAAFYPSAHGRSGVAVGAVGYGDRSCVTIRARSRDFNEVAAQALLNLIAGTLSRPLA
jgi:hypothetical protein